MRSILLLNFFFLFLSSQVSAEFKCGAEVSYKWKSLSSSQQASAPLEAEGTKVAAESTPSAESVNTSSSERSVFWTGVEQKAATEEEGKTAVTKLALMHRAAADKACISQHENLAGCIASKYNSISASLTNLSFQARKSMDEAIASDCKNQQGKCLGTNLSEVKCSEIVTAAPAAEAGKDTKDKKDPKKK